MNKKNTKKYKLTFIILIFFIVIILSANYTYSQNLTKEEEERYIELASHIKFIYEEAKNAFDYLYYDYRENKLYNNIDLGNITWQNLAAYEKSLPYINSKVYNDPKGLIITLWSNNNSKYFGSTKNYYQGIFAIEFNINNYILYRYKKYIYYLIDQSIDFSIDLSKGKVITGVAGINPLLQTGEITNLGNDSNYSSIYILCR